MHGRICRGLLTTAAASVTLAGLGLGAVPASASAAPASTAPAGLASPARHPVGQAHPQGLGSPVYSATRAGYEAGYGTGFRFRYIATTFTVPSCSDAAARHGWLGNEVELGADSTRWRARVLVTCAPGALGGASVTYRLLIGGRSTGVRALPLLPQAGDQVTLSAEYQLFSGRVRVAATDDSTRQLADRVVHAGAGALFYGAEAGSLFSRTAISPGRDLRTGDFAFTQVTNYNGRKGTILGTWPASQVIATRGGSPYGEVIADAPLLRDGGSSFDVYQRAR